MPQSGSFVGTYIQLWSWGPGARVPSPTPLKPQIRGPDRDDGRAFWLSGVRFGSRTGADLVRRLPELPYKHAWIPRVSHPELVIEATLSSKLTFGSSVRKRGIICGTLSRPGRRMAWTSRRNLLQAWHVRACWFSPMSHGDDPGRRGRGDDPASRRRRNGQPGIREQG